MSELRLIPEIIRRSAAEYADRAAVRWLERKDTDERTYAQLDSARKRVKNAMTARGFVGAHITKHLVELGANGYIGRGAALCGSAVRADVVGAFGRLVQVGHLGKYALLYLVKQFRHPFRGICCRE